MCAICVCHMCAIICAINGVLTITCAIHLCCVCMCAYVYHCHEACATCACGSAAGHTFSPDCYTSAHFECI